MTEAKEQVIRIEEGELKNNKWLLENKVCPYVGRPCIQQPCWQYHGLTTFAPEEKIGKNKEGRDEYGYTGKVLKKEMAQCRLHIYPQLVLSEEEAPGYSLDAYQRVVDPKGKPLSAL